jgi:hypothetical protein
MSVSHSGKLFGNGCISSLIIVGTNVEFEIDVGLDVSTILGPAGSIVILVGGLIHGSDIGDWNGALVSDNIITGEEDAIVLFKVLVLLFLSLSNPFRIANVDDTETARSTDDVAAIVVAIGAVTVVAAVINPIAKTDILTAADTPTVAAEAALPAALVAACCAICCNT